MLGEIPRLRCELVEAGEAVEDVAQDQDRPPLADRLEAERDRALGVREARPPHHATGIAGSVEAARVAAEHARRARSR